jgi:hypothetical protein
MADAVKCQECEDLKRASQDAYRYSVSYRPMHNGYRPKSRWFKADREAVEQAKRSYNMAQARYQIHLAAHAGDSANPRDVEKSLTILMREGRLKP